MAYLTTDCFACNAYKNDAEYHEVENAIIRHVPIYMHHL